MSEVVDVIHRLTFEVSGQQEVAKQVNKIDELIAQKEKLTQLFNTTQDVNQQQKLSTAILDLDKAIKKQTETSSQYLAQNKNVQQALTVELGLIQKLTDRLNDLRQARERQKDASGVKQINSEIAGIRKELSSLTDEGNKSSVLAQLFGGGSTGRQVLNGALLGLGVGGGFGFVTRAVSGIVDEMIKVGEEILNTVEYQEKLKKATEELTSSITHEADEFAKINQYASDVDGGVNAYKNFAETIKAVGVVRDQVFKHQQEVFTAEQAGRQRELEDTQKQIESYSRIKALLQSLIPLLDPTGANKGARGNYARIEGAFNDAAKSGVDRKVLDNLLLDIKKSGTDNGNADKNNTLTGYLTKLFSTPSSDFNTKIAGLVSSATKIQTAILSETLKNQHKIEDDTYQLHKKLTDDLRKLDEQYAQDRIKRQESTAENIKQSFANETKFAIEDVERRRALERKRLSGEGIPIKPYDIIENGKTKRVDPEADFNAEIARKRRSIEAEETEALRQYSEKRFEELEKYREQTLLAHIVSDRQKITEASGYAIAENVDLLKKMYDDELELQLSANDRQYEEQTKHLKKLKIELELSQQTETDLYKDTYRQLEELYQQHVNTEIDATRGRNIKVYAAYAEGYAKLLKDVNNNDSLIKLAIQTDTAKQIADIEQNYKGGFLSRGDTERVTNLKGDILTSEENKRKAEALLPEARRTSDAADAVREESLRTGSIEEQTAALREQQAAQAEVLRLEKEIYGVDEKITQDKRSIRNIYIEQAISDYRVLADSAVKAYGIIAEARQKELDAEIDARKERLDLAYKLAERGNTQALKQEQEAYDKAVKQKQRAAATEIEINSALMISYEILAITKAVAQYGLGSPIAIATILGALATGIAQAYAISKAEKAGFAEGGFTGEGGKYQPAGTVHKGEFVMNKENTEKFRPYLETMHKGFDPFNHVAITSSYNAHAQFATKRDLQDVKDGLKEVVDAIGMIGSIKINQSMDRRGVAQSVEQEIKAQRRKWR